MEGMVIKGKKKKKNNGFLARFLGKRPESVKSGVKAIKTSRQKQKKEIDKIFKDF